MPNRVTLEEINAIHELTIRGLPTQLIANALNTHPALVSAYARLPEIQEAKKVYRYECVERCVGDHDIDACITYLYDRGFSTNDIREAFCIPWPRIRSIPSIHRRASRNRYRRRMIERFTPPPRHNNARALRAA